MADDWIKVRSALPTDGRIKVVSRTCHASTVTVFGALVTLWCLGDTHASDEGLLHGYTADDIDALVGVPGFCAALPTDWIDLSGEWVKLPNYQEHNGSTAKARAQATKRKRRERIVTPESRSHRDTSVTREEKRREDKRTPVAPIPKWLDADLWAEFVAHRASIRKPLTEAATVRMLAKLDSLRASGVDVKAAIDDSIRCGWQDVFAPKAGVGPKATLGNPWDGAL